MIFIVSIPGVTEGDSGPLTTDLLETVIADGLADAGFDYDMIVVEPKHPYDSINA